MIGAGINIESFSGNTLRYVLLYVVLRTVGKYGGTLIACKVARLDPKFTATIPRLMLPQAELAVIETLLVASVLPASIYVQDIVNVVAASLLIFQLGGSFLTERTLLRWKHWIYGEQEALIADSKAAEVAAFKKLLHHRIIEIDSLNRKTTIDFISEYLHKEHIITDAEAVTNAVLERELLMSTAIGKGIAIPHCRLQSIQETVVVCTLLKTPVDWNAPDKLPVDLVFLIATPVESPESYLRTIRTISSTLHYTNFGQEIKAAYENGKAEEYLKLL